MICPSRLLSRGNNRYRRGIRSTCSALLHDLCVPDPPKATTDLLDGVAVTQAGTLAPTHDNSTTVRIARNKTSCGENAAAAPSRIVLHPEALPMLLQHL